MEKLLIGAIAALILLALIPVRDAPFTASNSDPVAVVVTNDVEEPKAVHIQLLETESLNGSELIIAQNEEIDNIENTEIETDQETADSDRAVFISIGSMILLGILLLLTPLRKF